MLGVMRRRLWSRYVTWGILLFLAGSAWAAQGAQELGDDKVALNFADTDIRAVIQVISKISGRNFVVDPRVKGTVTLVTEFPVPRSQTYAILTAALRQQGYAVVESNGVAQVIPESDAKLYATPFAAGQRDGSQLVTRVFTLRHESAAQALPVIRPLVSPNNSVTSYPGSNSLVVTDYRENIERIARTIASLDVPQGEVTVLPLRRASAVDVAMTVEKVLGADNAAGGADPSQRVSVSADANSNSLLVRTANVSKLEAVRKLVAALDVSGTFGNIHVVYLKNAEATKVAETLRAVVAGSAGALSSSASEPLASSGLSASSTSDSMTAQGAQASADSHSLSSGLTAATLSSPGGGGAGGMIQADASSNALIITAPEGLYNDLRKAIDLLDRRRAQVYVEALIAEISAESAAEFGIQWQASGSGNLSGGTNFSSGGSNILGLASGSTAGAGLNLIMGSGTVTVLGQQILDLNMLARALQTDSRVNILSTPNLITLDNEEAVMVVGQNLPFVTGQYTNTGSGSTVSNPFQTIERKDVGLTLRIKPQISESGTVRLQIYQEASSVVESTASNSNGPTTNKRSIQSTVLADNGAIIALGGLIEDSYSSEAERVPVISKVPILGRLFRYDSRTRKKTNLVVFLRPVILRDADSASELSNDRYDYVIGQQRQANRIHDEGLGSEPMVELPPRQTTPPAQPYYLPSGAKTPVRAHELNIQ
jgi:general secretion pathway protein D